VSRFEVSRSRLVLGCLVLSIGLVALVAPAMASAGDTVWICKPGQADDLCAGTIDGETMPPPGGAVPWIRQLIADLVDFVGPLQPQTLILFSVTEAET